MSKTGYERHIVPGSVFLCSMTAEQREEYFADLHAKEGNRPKVATRQYARRPMPAWCDNPAEWGMLCNRYGAGNISRCGRYADIADGDGTYRFERIV